jgi:addiction module HigA family antidote
MEGQMTEYTAGQRFPGRNPTHPGAVWREDVLPAIGLTVVDFADRLGVSRQTIHSILAEKQPVTTAMAARAGRLFDKDPALWLRMQQTHDLWCVQHEMAEELAHITPLAPIAPAGG